MPSQIRRFTLFKAEKDEDVEFLVEKYKVMKAEAKRDGKPYILSIIAGRCVPDPRSQGISFAVEMVFTSLQDMEYYDNEDAFHGQLKAGLKGKLAGPPVVAYFEEDVEA